MKSDNESRSFLESIKKDLDQNLLRQYGTLLDEVSQQFFTICEEDQSAMAREEAERFGFDDLIRNSPFKLNSSLPNTLLYFQKLIRDFSKEWDKQVNEDPNKNGSHLYFLTYIPEGSNTEVIAKEFNRFSKLDKKLIAITVPEDRIKIDYLPFLHEMGHFIGGRSRKKRRKLLKDLTILCFLRRVYDFCLDKYGGVQRIPSGERKSQVESALERRRNKYEGKFITDLEHIYEAIQRNFITNKEIRGWIKQHDGYAKDFVSGIMGILLESLGGGWEQLIKQLRDIENDEIVLNILKDSGYRALDYFSGDEIEDLAATINSLEEPIADSFMIKVGDISFRRYFKTILHQTWLRWERKDITNDVETYEEFFMAEVSRTRILAICLAMGARRNDIYSIWDKMNFFTREARNNRQIRRTIRNNHMIQQNTPVDNFHQNLLNPQVLVSNYIRDHVMNHEHYMKMEETELKPIIDQIRIYKSGWPLLIKFRIWLYKKLR